MTTAIAPDIAPQNYSEKQIRTSQRVLDDLDRADERFQAVYSKQRSHERKALRSIVTVLIPPDPEMNNLSAPIQFQCWGRNVSRSGLSCLHHSTFPAKAIVICLGHAPDGNSIWFHADLVRAREVQEGFWEYGARFTGRAMI